MEIDIRSVTRKPVSIVGSLGYTQEAWDRTVALIAAGRYPVERVVSSRTPRDEIVAGGFQGRRAPGRRGLKGPAGGHPAPQGARGAARDPPRPAGIPAGATAQ